MTYDVPPFDAQAEAAVIASCLVDPDAAARVAPIVSAADFYREPGGWRNTILVGDVREQLATLLDESVHCVVTSPPYWGLRDYGEPGQLGLEKTPEEFVCNLVAVFREVRRVLRKDGTVWLNLGDCYTGGRSGPGDRHHKVVPNLKAKDLVGLPWRVALALQADGWYLRSDIIWSKPNPMPESVTDRPTKAHEYVFLLAKNRRYFYDIDAVREPVKFPEDNQPEDHERAFTALRMNGPVKRQNGYKSGNRERKFRGDHGGNPSDIFQSLQGFGVPWEYSGGGRNKRSVWEIPTQPYGEAHFATYPEALVLPCIQAGTSEHGCCASCGAPWRRVSEARLKATSKAVRTAIVDSRDRAADAGDQGSNRQKSGHMNGFVRADRTTGWNPTCEHYDHLYRLMPRACSARQRGQQDAIDARRGCPGGWWSRVRRRPGLATWATEKAVVLDPFMGSGTTGLVAYNAGRDFVGIELNPTYAAMADRRIGTDRGRLL